MVSAAHITSSCAVGRRRFHAAACAILLLLLSSSLPVSAKGDGPSEIGIIYQGNAPPAEALKDLLGEYGSEVTGVVLRPEGGGYLVSVTKPSDSGQADALMNALQSGTGVTHVEANTCYEIYPDNILPESARHLTSDATPGPELLGSGEEPSWSPEVLQETTGENGVREFQSTTRERTTTTTTTRERRRTVGWSMVRDPPPTTPPPPEYPTPPMPPIEYDNMACGVPTTKADKGPDIKLKLVHGSPDAFQYPRPIPLQVLVRDYDEVTVQCDGCGGGPSAQRFYVEDGIALYKWQLNGKGSLNEPFKNIETDIQKRIDDLKKQIREKSEELAKLEAKKAALDASRDARRTALQEDIDRLETQKAEVEEQIRVLKQKIAEKEAALSEVTTTLETTKTRIEELLVEIDGKREQIKELQDKIDGKPSATSQQIADRLEELEKRIEQKRAELEQLKAEHLNREQTLAQAYDQALDTLVNARQNLARVRANVTAIQDEIVALENRLYANPAIRDVMRHRGNISRLGMNLQGGFLGGGLPQTLDLTNLAQQVLQGPNPDARGQLFAQFRSQWQQLLAGLQGQCAQAGTGASQCNELLSELQGEVEELDRVLDDALQNPGGSGSPEDWEKLDSLRQDLADMENEVRAAEQQVQAAEEGVSQAEASYTDGLAQMLQAEADLAGEIAALQSQAQEVSAELATARAKDEQERLENTPDWLDQIASLRVEIETLGSELTTRRIEAERSQEEKDKLADELRKLKAELSELEGRRNYLQMQIDQKRQELADIETETDQLEVDIQKLIDEIEVLETELRALLSGVTAATDGNKDAEGPQVFFIPPPLESTDGFNDTEFKRLKEDLADKEVAYEKAKAAKAQLQDDAYRILKGFTEQLWALKTANKTLADLDEEISELETEKSKQQTDAAQESNPEMAAEEERKAQLEAEKTEKDTAVEEKKRVEEQDKKRLENEEAELKQAESTRAEAERAASTAKSERDAADERRRATHRQQSDLMSRFRRTVNDLQNAEAALTRAQSALSRATTREDAAAISAARTEVSTARQQVETLNANVESQRPPLLELDRKMAQRIADLEQAQKALDDAEEDLRRKKDKFWEEVTDVTNAQNSVKQSTEARLGAERQVRETEDDIKRQDEAIRKAEDAKKAAEDEATKDTDKSLEEKNAAKADAEKDKNKAENKLAALQQEKVEWDKRKTEAEAEMVKARDELLTARDALKTFLQNEMRQVDHKVTLDLTVQDADIDDYRAIDTARNEPLQISYNKRRQPKIIGPDENLDPPGNVPANPSICNVSVNFIPEPQATLEIGPAPMRDEKVGVKGLEPKTIALYYRQGAPLYELWPPVPDSGNGGSAGGGADPANAPQGGSPAPAGDGAAGGDAGGNGGDDDSGDDKVLVKASTPFVTGAKDLDQLHLQCTPGGGGDAILVGEQGASGAGQMCLPGGESGGEIMDVTRAHWKTETYTNAEEHHTMVNVPEVLPNECEGETDFDVGYLDSRQQWPDEKSKKKKYSRLSGLKGDAPKRYDDFGKSDKVELRFQVYEGGHSGKGEQTVEWKVDGIQPAIDEDKYGLGDGKKKALEGDDAETTDGSGYSKVDFHLAERWGRATVTAKWKRKKEECESATMEILRLLTLREIKIGFAPKNGWEQGKEAWKGNTDYAALAEALEGDGPETASSLAVGLLDDWLDPVDEQKILFSIVEPGEAGVDPEEMVTEIYGLAWSFATDLPEESTLKMKAEVDAELKPVTEPPSIEAEQSTSTENRFYMGPEGGRLTFETDEPYVPGDPYTGGAKLVLEGEVADIPVKFSTLALEAEAVVVDDDGSLVATAGSVTWKASGAAGEEFEVPGFAFKFRLKSLGINAGDNAIITGEVKVPQHEGDPIAFEAIFGPKGFIGRAKDFPEMSFGEVKLEQGAAIVVDMHSEEDPDDLDLKGNWRGKGLVIVQASLLLPESMKGEAATPPKISVKNFFFNSTGLNGELDVQYTVAARLGKVEFSIEKVLVEFQANELHKGEFKGQMALADPFHGTIGATASLDRAGKYAFVVETDRPVTAPSLGLTVKLDRMGGEYDQNTEIFTFTLAGQMRSETFTDIDVDKFVVKSTGDVEAKIAVNKDIQIGKGFDARLGTFELVYTETDFRMGLQDAEFKFNDMLTAEKASITIAKGPVIESFSISIDGNKDPVTFKTSITYSANTFQGSLKLGIDKLLEVDGTFILGTQQKEDESEFTYWYVELNSKVAIPLGQTGLNIIQLGGGVGYNYDPPIGQAPGAIRNTDTFSLKAAIAVGNVPRGEVFAGRLTMVLVSGRFSVNGLVWLLEKETSLFGEGQLDMYWSDPARLEGFVRMMVALPGSEGKLLNFSGQVDFRFAGSNDWFVKSRTLEGALLEKVIAEGKIDVTRGRALLEGNVRYDLDKSVPLAVVTLQVQVHLRADGKVEFVVTESQTSLDSRLGFRGDMDVTLETRVRNFDLASAVINAELVLKANNQSVTVRGSADVSWDTWVHSGSAEVDIGYSLQ